RLVGGIERVIRQNHFSKHLETRDLFVKSWSDLISLLATAPEDEFHGYAEAEVISAQHRMPIKCQPFNASIPFPFGPFEQELCPPDKHKDFDLHITVDLKTADPDLKRLLENEIRFYYVDVLKHDEKLVRVY